MAQQPLKSNLFDHYDLLDSQSPLKLGNNILPRRLDNTKTFKLIGKKTINDDVETIDEEINENVHEGLHLHYKCDPNDLSQMIQDAQILFGTNDEDSKDDSKKHIQNKPSGSKTKIPYNESFENGKTFRAFKTFNESKIKIPYDESFENNKKTSKFEKIRKTFKIKANRKLNHHRQTQKWQDIIRDHKCKICRKSYTQYADLLTHIRYDFT